MTIPSDQDNDNTDIKGDNPKILAIDDECLVVRSGVLLPKKCVFCNKEQGQDGKRYSKRLYYVSPYIWLFILLNVVILLIAYFISRKPIDLTYSICDDHKRLQNKRAMYAGGSLFVMIISFIVAATFDMSAFTFIGVVAVVGLLISLVNLSSNRIVMKKHENGRFWVKGCCEDFMADAFSDTGVDANQSPTASP